MPLISTATFMILLGTLITISSTHPLINWLGLELNTLGFLPLLKHNNNPASSESIMKYFLIQAISSALFILSTTTTNFFHMLNLNSMTLMLITFSLMIKLGLAPLHFWMFPMVQYSPWISLFLFLTWQKIAPLSILLLLSSSYIMMFLIISLIMSPIMMSTQNSMKKFFTYASIAHMAWLFIAGSIHSSLPIMYFLMYCLSSMPIFLMLLMLNINFINQIPYLTNHSKLLLFLNMMSLGGFPPLLGFLPKMLVIINVTSQIPIFMILLMVMSSIMMMYSYISVILMTLTSPPLTLLHPYSSPFLLSSILLIPSITSLFLPLLFL